MNPLIAFFRSFGNDRAVANAAVAQEERRREDWLVQGLARRLDRVPTVASRPATLRVAS